MKDLLVFAITAVLLCIHKNIKPVVTQKEREFCVEPTFQNDTGIELPTAQIVPYGQPFCLILRGTSRLIQSCTLYQES